jgi:hypothetical protein
VKELESSMGCKAFLAIAFPGASKSHLYYQPALEEFWADNETVLEEFQAACFPKDEGMCLFLFV